MTSLSEMVRVFGHIGLVSFGGPAAQIALMHRELVEKRLWMDEATYLRALSLCMLLPGPEAMQLATYAGWRMRGVMGGLLAGLLFVVPGALVIVALALAYIHFGSVPFVQSAFLGIKAAVIAIVLQALVRISRKALKGPIALALALSALVSLFVFGLPFPIVIAFAALVGWFLLPRETPAPEHRDISSSPVRTALVCGALWATPLGVLWLTSQEFLLQIGLFFSRLAVVTFGGAYAVLTYMTQEVVTRYQWITTGQMIDALGLAETTPGPLILVTEFVALLAGFAHGGIGLALAAGLVSLWVTFVPCFLWIFLAGPYVERLATWTRLAAALQGISAAVVGVIANLSLWFALHVLFHDISTHGALAIPNWSSFDPIAFLLVIASTILLLGFKLSLPLTLILMASVSVMMSIF